MEYILNLDFNLMNAIENVKRNNYELNNEIFLRHKSASAAVSEIYLKTFQEDLNLVLPLDVQKSLNLTWVTSCNILDVYACFEFHGNKFSIGRFWVGNRLFWRLENGEYQINCVGDALQREILLSLGEKLE